MYADRPHEDGTATRAVTFWGTTSGETQCLTCRVAPRTDAPRLFDAEADAKCIRAGRPRPFHGPHAQLSVRHDGHGLVRRRHPRRPGDGVRARRLRIPAQFGVACVGLFGEGCNSGDMTQVASGFRESGAGDYWEDVDPLRPQPPDRTATHRRGSLQKAISTMTGPMPMANTASATAITAR